MKNIISIFALWRTLFSNQ